MIGNTETTLLLILASAFLLVVFLVGYNRTRDPLHPVVFLAPLFFLGLVVEPAQRLIHPDITRYFPDYQGLGYALFVQYLGMAALFIGLLSVRTVRLPRHANQSLLDPHLTPADRAQLRALAWIVTAFCLFGFWSGIGSSGGFFQVYSGVKGNIRSYSGYLGESQNLGVAAVVLYALGCQTRRLRPADFIAALIMASPLLIHGTFGGRRGPLFLVLSALFVAYWIARGRVPRPRVIATAFILFVAAILFVQSQRQHLYLGSGEGIRWAQFFERVLAEEVEAGDNFVTSSGAVIATTELGEYHFGRRIITTYLIRPIPRQIWPDKYNDTAALLYGEGESHASIVNQFRGWEQVLGWHPPGGYATNAIVDFYMEFSWGYLLAAFGLGRLIGLCWRNFRTRGGFWFVLYVSVAALSIYLPTQSIRAFAVRFLYLSIMTAVFWKFVVGKIDTRRKRVARTAGCFGLGNAPMNEAK